MINLIPPEGHTSLKHEYYTRVVATFCFLFGAIFLLLTVAYIPTYILINAQTQTLVHEQEKKSDEDLSSIESEINTIQSVLKQLSRDASTELPSSLVIQEIEHYMIQGITFKNIILERSSNERIERVQVQGVAPTREILAQFKNAIESSEMFARAEVPIADLVKDVDLPFVITITLDHT